MTAARSPRVLLAFALLLPTTLSLGGASASHDADPPVVTGWSFNALSFEPGDVFTIEFNVSDASNLRSVNFTLSHEESGQAAYTVGFAGEDRAPGWHNASFVWLESVRGNYSLDHYYVEDVNGNRNYTFAPFEGPAAGSPTRVFLGPSQVNIRAVKLLGPSVAEEGQSVQYAASIQNMGDGSVAPFNVTFAVDGVPQTVRVVDGLASGEDTWLQFNWTATAGDHRVVVGADSSNAVGEDNESDNTLSRDLRVAGPPGPAPDLTISSLDVLNGNVTEGDTVHVNATVRNEGDANASVSTVAFLVDGAWHDARNVTGLAPGESATLTFSWVAAPGTHTLGAWADAYSFVAERDETNNARNVTVRVAPSSLPDLVVASLETLPFFPSEGDAVYVNATVRNDGDASASAFDVAFFVDGARQGARNVSGLAPGESANVVFWWTAVAGEHHLAVLADGSRLVTESDERNNGANATVVVNASLPDLAVSGLSAPSNLSEGDWAVLGATVVNKGGQAAWDFPVDFYVDGVFHDRLWVWGLAPGSAVDVQTQWIATAGDHVVIVLVDATQRVVERDEDNNGGSIALSVRALPDPDVAVTILGSARVMLRTDLGPLAPNPIHARTVGIEVANLGAGETGRVQVALYARPAGALLVPGSATFVGVVYLEAVAPGERAVVEIEWDVTRFFGDVELIAEAYPERPDADWSNNADVYQDFVLVGGTGFGLRL